MTTSTYPKSSNFTKNELEVLRDAQYGFTGIKEYKHCIRVKEVFGTDIYFMKFKHWAVSKDYTTILYYDSWHSDCSNRPNDYYNAFTDWCENYIPLDLVEYTEDELDAARQVVKKYKLNDRPDSYTLRYSDKKTKRQAWRNIYELEKMWKGIMNNPSQLIQWRRTGIIY